MTVFFIGAGPGDPELITVKGARLVASCPLVLFTGSLVPPEVIAGARPDAQVADSAGMTLAEMVEAMAAAHAKGWDVARVHTGDPTLFGAIAEQIRELDRRGIPWQIIPGVSSFTAAAAALGRELTLPELSQTVILSRVEGRTPMPPKEQLSDLARTRATLVLFLSVGLLDKLAEELIPFYGADCPAAVVYRASWPDQKIVRATLAELHAKVRREAIRSQSIVMVGRVLDSDDFAPSRLYDPAFAHKFRKAAKTGSSPAGEKPKPSANRAAAQPAKQKS